MEIRLKVESPGAVWDMLDYSNDGYDQYGEGFGNIWNILYNVNTDTFYQYWQARKSYGYNINNSIGCLYQNTIDYNQQPNLTPSQPSGWSDKIVITNKSGCTGSSCTDSSPLLDGYALCGFSSYQ